MDNYSLKPDETILFQGDAYDGIQVILTNHNLIIVKKKEKLFSKTDVTVEVYPKEEIKIYKDVPQIKANNCNVMIYLLSKEIQIEFKTRGEVHKFTSAAFELLTGKTAFARGAEKVKNAVDVVDNTLGINTVETVKSVVTNGVIGCVTGGLGKKINKASKGKNSKMKMALNATKGVLESKALVSEANSHLSEQTPDYDEQIQKLEKMKSLLDSGVITQEEFDTKKAELLGKL